MSFDPRPKGNRTQCNVRTPDRRAAAEVHGDPSVRFRTLSPGNGHLEFRDPNVHIRISR